MAVKNRYESKNKSQKNLYLFNNNHDSKTINYIFI